MVKKNQQTYDWGGTTCYIMETPGDEQAKIGIWTKQGFLKLRYPLFSSQF